MGRVERGMGHQGPHPPEPSTGTTFRSAGICPAPITGSGSDTAPDFLPKPSPPGEFSVAGEGKRILNGIYPGGVYTHLLSGKHNGVIQSPRFTIDSNFISLSVLGSDFSFAQLIVENYAVPRGGIYHMRHNLKTDRMEWVQWDVAYWKGFSAYIELATRDDVTLTRYDSTETRTKAEKLTDGRSAIGASRILFHETKETPQRDAPAASLSAPGPATPLARRCGRAIGPPPGGSHRSLAGWRRFRAPGRISGRVRPRRPAAPVPGPAPPPWIPS